MWRLWSKMERVVRVHYGGSVLESSNGGSQFDGMSVKTIVFQSKPTFEELLCRTKDILGWSDKVSVAGTVTHFANLANRNEELEAQLQQLRSSFNILQVFATPFAAVLICIIAIAAWRFT
uniref:Uncharacterized protein n=1 Tax=Oryza glumipatula TaxID=40148 RepID=A0A0E0A1E9_9ORYZ